MLRNIYEITTNTSVTSFPLSIQRMFIEESDALLLLMSPLTDKPTTRN